jgi:hypothetical protein
MIRPRPIDVELPMPVVHSENCDELAEPSMDSPKVAISNSQGSPFLDSPSSERHNTLHMTRRATRTLSQSQIFKSEKRAFEVPVPSFREIEEPDEVSFHRPSYYIHYQGENKRKQKKPRL